MAIQTLATTAITSLTAVRWLGAGVSSGSSVRSVNTLIRDDQNATHPLAQTSGCGGFVKEGVLYVPNRGSLTLFPDDVVMVDATAGQVIVVPISWIGINWFYGIGQGGTNGADLDHAVVWGPTISQADVADINANIVDDRNPRNPLAQTNGSGGFVREGILYVPNRGALTLFPGDVVATATTAPWPILLTAYGLSAGPWTLT